MKKIKRVLICLILLLFPLCAFACDNGKDKPVKIESIELNSYNVTLRPSESFDLTLTYSPSKVDDDTINYMLTDSSVVNVEKIDNLNYKLTAKSNVSGTLSTYIQFTSEDGNAKSEVCKITVYTEITQLFAPTNLRYDNIEQKVVWDNVAASNGYALLLGEDENSMTEYFAPTNYYKGEAIYNKPLICKVKSLGDGTLYSDSEFTESFKFLQLTEPANLRNEGTKVFFNKVENANSYVIYIENGNDKFEREILDADYNAQEGFDIDLLKQVGNFNISVSAVPENVDDGVFRYSSTHDVMINIERFAAPESLLNFKFNFNNKTFSWKTVDGAKGYVLRQMYGGNETLFEFSEVENTYQIDTQTPLQSGIYQYQLKVIGNDISTLNSSYSTNIEITKLEAPTAKVEKGIIVWNDLAQSSSYIYELSPNQNSTLTTTDELSLKLGDDYDGGAYKFKIKAVGDGESSISSEFSDIQTFTKLSSSEKPSIENNTNLVLKTSSLTEVMEVYLTGNDGAPQTIVLNNNDFELDGETKIFKIDMSKADYAASNYIVYTKCYGTNFLYSNKSEDLTFTKLTNTNTAKITNGKLSWSLVDQAEQVKVFIGTSTYTGIATAFEDLPENFYNIKAGEGNATTIKLQYLPKPNTDIIVSNVSDSMKLEKLEVIKLLYVEDGEITLGEYNSTKGALKYIIDDGRTIYEESSVTRLKENTTYSIKAYINGGSEYLSSDYSNYIKVKVLPVIDDLTLGADRNTFSFSDVGADSYDVKFQTEKQTNSVTIYSTSFSLNEKIPSYFTNYENLNNLIEVSVSYIGGTSYDQTENVILVNRDYALNQKDPNVVSFKILPPPTSLTVFGLFDSINNATSLGTNFNFNSLYLEASSSITMFNLTYKNTSTDSPNTIILTRDNYLKQVGTKGEGNVLYEVNTSFLTAGTYDLEIRSTSQGTMLNGGKEVYVIDSFGIATFEGAKKIAEVNNIDCKDDQIIINDSDNDYIYVLKINGKLIYDDILDKGQGLTNLISYFSGDEVSQRGKELIEDFKSTTRTLKENYNGVLSISAVKFYISSDDASGNNYIQSEPCAETTVTRLKTVNATLKNGCVEWSAPDNTHATSFEVSILPQLENTSKYDEENKISVSVDKSINQNYSVSLVEKLSNASGNYGVKIRALTTESGYLSSVETETLAFTILKAPELKVKDGKIAWNEITGAQGYELNIVGNGVNESQKLQSSKLEYELNGYQSGDYKFTIQSLGAFTGDETSCIKSSLSAEFGATKLVTPEPATIEDGQLKFYSVANGNYYKVVNEDQQLTIVNFTTGSYLYSLKGKSGDYNISYMAIGTEDSASLVAQTYFLNSDYSKSASCHKLKNISTINMEDGALVWNNIENNNGYNISGLWENSKVNEQNINNCAISTDTNIKYGTYNVSIYVKGDSTMYLNSDDITLQNVKKLDNVNNIRIVNGELTWDEPNSIKGVGANESSKVPNILKITFTKDNFVKSIQLEEGATSYELGKEFEAGIYSITFNNIGIDDQLYASANIVEDSKRKLNAPTNVNIDDGLHIKWDNTNIAQGKDALSFKINITQEYNDETKTYSGVISFNEIKSIYSILFANLMYDKVNKTIVDSTADGVNKADLEPIKKQGRFKVTIQSFGGTTKENGSAFINSDLSNEIIITVPNPVTELKITHGKITWESDLTNGGYILTITRTDLDGNIDAKSELYNKENALVYVSEKEYNLADVNYIYTVSVCAYSWRDADVENKMASEPVVFKDYLFNSFTEGNGSAESPYAIDSAETMTLIQYNNKAHYILKRDIKLINFVPLFDQKHPFVGDFDGDNFTLDITINTNKEYSGIFGYISTKNMLDVRIIDGVEQSKELDYVGNVHDIIISNVTITQGVNVGAIAGYNKGKISNISIIDGNISTTTTPSVDVGASAKPIYTGSIVAINEGEIYKVINNAIVKPTSSAEIYAGGLVGQNKEGAIIEDSENHGEVAGVVAGGISAINKGLIKLCNFTSNIYVANLNNDVSQLLAMAGGISATNSGIIQYCTVYNKEFGAGSSEQIYSWRGIIDNSTSNLSENILLGGLVGDNEGVCEYNVAKIEVRKVGSSINALLGLIFGYNANNQCEHNIAFISSNSHSQTDAVQGRGVPISETNIVVSNLNSQAILESLNSNTDNIEWAVEDGLLVPSIKQQEN